ncbi:hypothetical protein [Intrasporangium flavum]|uniref:hypothetical protein n=1 Tax=Intrasporangium flavum TaxID=1428657 RepID=UPI00096F3F8D|nr:hypothetical protein [Intrasporangium flavum]
MSTHDESTPGLTDTDINSERPDGSGGEGTSATTSGTSDGSPADASGAATDEDVERGNADGSTPSAAPREDVLGDAQDTTGSGTGSDAQAWADQASAEGESGQDNGLNE